MIRHFVEYLSSTQGIKLMLVDSRKPSELKDIPPFIEMIRFFDAEDSRFNVSRALREGYVKSDYTFNNSIRMWIGQFYSFEEALTLNNYFASRYGRIISREWTHVYIKGIVRTLANNIYWVFHNDKVILHIGELERLTEEI